MATKVVPPSATHSALLPEVLCVGPCGRLHVPPLRDRTQNTALCPRKENPQPRIPRWASLTYLGLRGEGSTWPGSPSPFLDGEPQAFLIDPAPVGTRGREESGGMESHLPACGLCLKEILCPPEAWFCLSEDAGPGLKVSRSSRGQRDKIGGMLNKTWETWALP